MPKTINRIELLGRVGTEPEMRYTPGGTAVTSLRVATDRQTAGGETVTDWHSVVCWGKLGEAVNSYVERGSRIYVAGRLEHRSYEDGEGQKRYKSEINALDVVFLDSKNGGIGRTDEAPTPQDDDGLPF